MKTSKGFLLWVLMLVGVLAVLTINHHLSETKLREEELSLRHQSDQLAVLTEENIRLSNMVTQATSPEARPNEPSPELLRLRGKVAQLRNEADLLRQENRQLRGPSLNAIYAMSGYDTNGLPDPDLGATREEVLSELRKGPATITFETDSLVRAEAVVAKTGGGSATLVMRFGFDEGGKLDSRTDSGL
jgi:hypothetical protein